MLVGDSQRHQPVGVHRILSTGENQADTRIGHPTVTCRREIHPGGFDGVLVGVPLCLFQQVLGGETCQILRGLHVVGETAGETVDADRAQRDAARELAGPVKEPPGELSSAVLLLAESSTHRERHLAHDGHIELAGKTGDFRAGGAFVSEP